MVDAQAANERSRGLPLAGEDYAWRNGGTCYHASCTCMMGTHPMSVADSKLRVHGLDGPRLIDATVMPAVASTNTNASDDHDRRETRADGKR